MTTTTKNKGGTNIFSSTIFMLYEIIKFIGLIAWYFILGLSTINLKNKYRMFDLFFHFFASVLLGYSNYFYTWWPEVLSTSLGPYLFWAKANVWYLYYTLLFIFLTGLYGHQKRMTKIRMLKALDILKSKPDDIYPKVVSVKKIDEFKTLVNVDSPKLGLDDFIKNKDRLEASFNREIDKIERTDSPRYLNIHLTTKKLPTKVSYRVLKEYCYKPCEFLLGESQGGILTYDIRKLPHMLIAGATGFGKSNHFKQILLTLTKNTNHLQMHLLDLKGGIEMNVFKSLPNVNVVTTMDGALATLERLKEEMDDRFRYLAANGHNKLVPLRDKRDRIIIAVDEASVLYMKRYAQSEDGKLALKARQVTDEIAKLSRAAGIHLILATQKVTKDTIDTHIRENLSGRISFKANDLEASRTVLGNGKARDLPEIPGRGIFHVGSKFIEFQAPLINTEELKQKVKHVEELFRLEQKEIFQASLLTPMKVTKRKSQKEILANA
jgi:S-DNA-T family DNA segregation ATPase FtsK/SpoIIIE